MRRDRKGEGVKAQKRTFGGSGRFSGRFMCSLWAVIELPMKAAEGIQLVYNLCKQEGQGREEEVGDEHSEITPKQSTHTHTCTDATHTPTCVCVCVGVTELTCIRQGIEAVHTFHGARFD